MAFQIGSYKMNILGAALYTYGDLVGEQGKNKVLVE